MDVLQRNGNGSYRITFKALGFILSCLIVFSGVIIFVTSGNAQTETNAQEIKEMKEDYVPRGEYDIQQNYIKEKLDEISRDVKEIKNK